MRKVDVVDKICLFFFCAYCSDFFTFFKILTIADFATSNCLAVPAIDRPTSYTKTTPSFSLRLAIQETGCTWLKSGLKLRQVTQHHNQLGGNITGIFIPVRSIGLESDTMIGVRFVMIVVDGDTYMPRFDK